jgi:hypothetical protein
MPAASAKLFPAPPAALCLLAAERLLQSSIWHMEWQSHNNA